MVIINRRFCVLTTLIAALCCTSAGYAVESLKLQIPGGPPLPQPTSAFVSFCKTDPHNCEQYIMLDSIKAMLASVGSLPFCIPDEFGTDKGEKKNWRKSKPG